MRQITKDSINAFIWGFTFSKQNMRVRVFNDVIKLQLHGNTIATKDRITNKIQISNAGWESNTTKERLNGLIYLSGSNVKPIYQKNWVWYLNGKEWDGNFTPIN
jgi:hypothetical protein